MSEQCRSCQTVVESVSNVSNVSNLKFDTNGASSHILLSKWCRTSVELVSKCRVEMSKPGLRQGALISKTIHDTRRVSTALKHICIITCMHKKTLSNISFAARESLR